MRERKKEREAEKARRGQRSNVRVGGTNSGREKKERRREWRVVRSERRKKQGGR